MSPDATDLRLTWSENENVVWKTPIHDSGWSSPVIWRNQIWLTTATDDGKQSFVICVDRRNGEILHDLKLFDNENPEDTRKYNSFVSPTPVIETGRVYKELAVNQLADGFRSSPAVAGRALFLRTEKNLYRIEKQR